MAGKRGENIYKEKDVDGENHDCWMDGYTQVNKINRLNQLSLYHYNYSPSPYVPPPSQFLHTPVTIIISITNISAILLLFFHHNLAPQLPSSSSPLTPSPLNSVLGIISTPNNSSHHCQHHQHLHCHHVHLHTRTIQPQREYHHNTRLSITPLSPPPPSTPTHLPATTTTAIYCLIITPSIRTLTTQFSLIFYSNTVLLS